MASWPTDGRQAWSRGVDCGNGGLGWPGSPVPPSCALCRGEAAWRGLEGGAGADGRDPEVQGRQSKSESSGFLGKCGCFPIAVLTVGWRRGTDSAAATCRMTASQSMLCHLPCRESLAPWLPKVSVLSPPHGTCSCFGRAGAWEGRGQRQEQSSSPWGTDRPVTAVALGDRARCAQGFLLAHLPTWAQPLHPQGAFPGQHPHPLPHLPGWEQEGVLCLELRAGTEQCFGRGGNLVGGERSPLEPFLPIPPSAGSALLTCHPGQHP